MRRDETGCSETFVSLYKAKNCRASQRISFSYYSPPQGHVTWQCSAMIFNLFRICYSFSLQLRFLLLFFSSFCADPQLSSPLFFIFCLLNTILVPFFSHLTLSYFLLLSFLLITYSLLLLPVHLHPLESCDNQNLPFQGHVEVSTSLNKGNSVEFLYVLKKS